MTETPIMEDIRKAAFGILLSISGVVDLDRAIEFAEILIEKAKSERRKRTEPIVIEETGEEILPAKKKRRKIK